jgi:hypothetical protein
MFDMNEDGLLDAEEYVLFDETRALDMENNGGHGRGAMVQASEGMTLPFNDVDADGAVSLAEFLGQAPAWIGGMDPRRRRRHHDLRFRPEPRLRANCPVRPVIGRTTSAKGTILWDLKGSGSTARRFRDLSEQEVLGGALVFVAGALIGGG